MVNIRYISEFILVDQSKISLIVTVFIHDYILIKRKKLLSHERRLTRSEMLQHPSLPEKTASRRFTPSTGNETLASSPFRMRISPEYLVECYEKSLFTNYKNCQLTIILNY